MENISWLISRILNVNKHRDFVASHKVQFLDEDSKTRVFGTIRAPPFELSNEQIFDVTG